MPLKSCYLFWQSGCGGHNFEVRNGERDVKDEDFRLVYGEQRVAERG